MYGNAMYCLFPCHLHTVNQFCFKNDVIITLNGSDSSHYSELLCKGNVYIYISCLHYRHCFLWPKRPLTLMLCMCLNGTVTLTRTIVWFMIIKTSNALVPWMFFAWSKKNQQNYWKIISTDDKQYFLSVIVIGLINFVQCLVVKSEFKIKVLFL